MLVRRCGCFQRIEVIHVRPSLRNVAPASRSSPEKLPHTAEEPACRGKVAAPIAPREIE